MTAGSMATALELRGGQHVTCHVLTDCWAARSRHGAGSTLTGELKEHRSQQCRKLFTSGFHGEMQLRLRHLPRLVAWCGVPECASAVFLEENGAPFTLTTKPRIAFSAFTLLACCTRTALGETSPVTKSSDARAIFAQSCGYPSSRVPQ